ncbi:MAG: hypothetical protein GY804_00550 [Alphaproteobacteria bacterium]|nr:hypothetical protein [Alphaproteobacteria bacterium]
MEELKKWLQSRIGVAWDEPANEGIIWKDRLFAYTAVLKKIEEIENLSTENQGGCMNLWKQDQNKKEEIRDLIGQDWRAKTLDAKIAWIKEFYEDGYYHQIEDGIDEDETRQILANWKEKNDKVGLVEIFYDAEHHYIENYPEEGE